MAEIAVRIVYNQDRKRRVVIFRRSEGSCGAGPFGFEEQHFSDDPLEMA